MDLLTAAKEMKRFIDVQPPKRIKSGVSALDVRETETYRLASAAIESAETLRAREALDLS